MGRKGENLSGHKRICSSCQKPCDPFMPSNTFIVEFCKECFEKLTVAQRLMVVAEWKQAHHLSEIQSLMAEYIRSGDAIQRASRKNEGN